MVTPNNNNQPKTVKPALIFVRQLADSGILKSMGNTVGSKFLFKSAEDYYILGLWLADGYWRSSSIGLTSINQKLINRFEIFLKRVSFDHPIKKRIYEVREGDKRKHKAIQIYVNSRSLTRLFMKAKAGNLLIPKRYLYSYLAGRIDGDGCIDTKYRSGIRIAYSSRKDASRDQTLIGKNNASVYHYCSANTYVIYLKKHYREKIWKELSRFCFKLAP